MRVVPWLRAVGLAAFSLAFTAGAFTVELKCEEAAKHLADCCPDLAPGAFECVSGCRIGPSFSLAQAECLLGLDCATLRREGACAWPKGDPPDGAVNPSMACQ